MMTRAKQYILLLAAAGASTCSLAQDPVAKLYRVSSSNDVIITGIPEDIKGEPDPQAKVVAAMFSEILSLRNRIIQLENGSGAPPAAPPELERRVGMLEMTLMQQTQSLTQGARAAREEAVRQLLVEQQQTAGQPGGVPVVNPAAHPQPQIQADAGDGPAGPTGAATSNAAVGANGPAGPGSQ